MTLKAEVKKYFSRPPCFFEWGENDTEAVSQGSAVLQCPTDDKASLAAMMPPNNDRIVRYNTTLLVLLLTVAGWKSGDRWLAECFRAAAMNANGGEYAARHGRMAFRVIINRKDFLTTLTCEGQL